MAPATNPVPSMVHVGQIGPLMASGFLATMAFRVSSVWIIAALLIIVWWGLKTLSAFGSRPVPR